jgi:hypothetical protein
MLFFQALTTHVMPLGSLAITNIAVLPEETIAGHLEGQMQSINFARVSAVVPVTA